MEKNKINQTSSKILNFCAGANLFKGLRSTRPIKNENLMWSIVPKTGDEMAEPFNAPATLGLYNSSSFC